MTREDALRKLRKLTAITTDRGASEAEAIAAAGIAARLMADHEIEAMALEIESAAPAEAEEPIERWGDPLDAIGNQRERWRMRLAIAVARGLGCEILRNGPGLAIVGRAGRVQTVRYVYAYCVREIARLAKQRARGNGRTWARSYRLGLIDAIRDAIREEQRAAREEALEAARAALAVDPRARALVVIEQAIARTTPEAGFADCKAFLQGLGFRYGSGRGESYGDRSARERGRADGAGIYRGGGGGTGIGSGTRRLGAGFQLRG